MSCFVCRGCRIYPVALSTLGLQWAFPVSCFCSRGPDHISLTWPFCWALLSNGCVNQLNKETLNSVNLKSLSTLATLEEYGWMSVMDFLMCTVENEPIYFWCVVLVAPSINEYSWMCRRPVCVSDFHPSSYSNGIFTALQPPCSPFFSLINDAVKMFSLPRKISIFKTVSTDLNWSLCRLILTWLRKFIFPVERVVTLCLID